MSFKCRCGSETVRVVLKSGQTEITDENLVSVDCAKCEELLGSTIDELKAYNRAVLAEKFDQQYGKPPPGMMRCVDNGVVTDRPEYVIEQ